MAPNFRKYKPRLSDAVTCFVAVTLLHVASQCNGSDAFDGDLGGGDGGLGGAGGGDGDGGLGGGDGGLSGNDSVCEPKHFYSSGYHNDSGKERLVLGYLTAANTLITSTQGRLISGALVYAINSINEDPSLLPNHHLDFMWDDNQANTLASTARLTEQWRKGAIAFFGPEDTCDTEARVAAAWNLPMISYKCADHKVSDKSLYPTFARTFPPATQVTRSIIALLLHYNWRKFSLVVGSRNKWQSIAAKIEEQAELLNLTVNGRFHFNEPQYGNPESYGNPFPSIVGRSYIHTRIYVYLGEHNGMIDLMSNLESRGLLANGEYMVIHLDFQPLKEQDDPLRYFKRTLARPNHQSNLDAARSLFVITISLPSNPDYSNFTNVVNFYNRREPFCFENHFGVFFGLKKKITVYAAYLYDAVFLYARALDEVLREGGSPRDGRAIIEKLRGRAYMSIQGFLTKMDKNGDAEGNYTVMSRQLFSSEHSNYSVIPVGHFEVSPDQEVPSFKLLDGAYIDWVGGKPPLDEPPCGYLGQKCIPKPNYTMEIICGVLGAVVFVAAIVVLIVYRNWRYEQEIAGLLWKIYAEDIQGLNSGFGNLHSSHMTLHSQASFDSRISLAQVFTVTGTYKGQLVALKRFTKRHLDISRSTKKEMKLMKDMRHDNVNAFIGACLDQSNLVIVTEYCAKGSLQDILENDDVKLDSMFVASLVMDLIKGMIFIHDNELHVHGNLKSSNCVVNSRWTLQVADFGLADLRRTADHDDDEHVKYRNQLWTAPELLRYQTPFKYGTQKGDVYAFGIILYEIIGRCGPYGNIDLTPKEIIHRVLKADTCFRPDVTKIDCQDYVITCMQDCWEEIPEARPDFRSMRSRLKPMRQGMKTNIFDNMLAMMEKYQTHLEDLVAERTELLVEEKKKTEGLLHRMLPKTVADQLVSGEAVRPEAFSCVTIYFSDICGFTALSAASSPMEVVDLLNDLYTLFDSIIRNYDVYKVETIGDAYMVVSGLPIRNGHNHAGEIASMSLHLLSAIKNFKIQHIPNSTISLRIGMHSGSCVAGVVGLTMPRYCLFGDTVNTASRMESNGEALKIHVSSEGAEILRNLGGYVLEPRGLVAMKGKGEVYTYWLVEEDKSVRMLRIHSGQNQPPTYVNVQTGNPHCRKTTKAPDNTSSFLELIRDSSAGTSTGHSGLRRAPSNCLRRIPSNSSGGIKRRSLDGRSTNSDLPNGVVSGGLNRHSSHSDRGQVDGTAPLDTSVPLPFIVVDKNPAKRESSVGFEPLETDRLLDSGISSDESDKRSSGHGMQSLVTRVHSDTTPVVNRNSLVPSGGMEKSLSESRL